MANKLHLTITVLLVALLFSACEKDDNSTAGCDVNGIWIGEWESNQQMAGTFCANVSQDNTLFNGDICIRIDMPDGSNYNRDFEGTVKNKNARTVISVSGVEIAAEGDITNDTLVDGSFSVPSLDMHGTFNGKKIPTSEADLTEIYSSPQGVIEHISDFVYVNNQLWVFMYPAVDIEGEIKDKVLKFDMNGNNIETIYYPYLSGSISSDGEYIWEEWNGDILSKYDINGNKLDSLNLAGSFYDLMYCTSSHFYFLYGDEILKTGLSLNITERINTAYFYPYAFAIYKNFQLCSSGNIIYKMDQNENVIHAYVLPDEWTITDIETNGDKVWCFINWYDENAINDMYPFRYSIYEVAIN